MAQDTSKSDGLEGFVTRVEANGHIRAALDALNALHRDSRSAYCFVELVRVAFAEHGALHRDHINGFSHYVQALARHVRNATDNLAEAHRLMLPEDYEVKEAYEAPRLTELGKLSAGSRCPACNGHLVTLDEGLTISCDSAECTWHAPQRQQCQVCKQRNALFTWGAAWKLGPFAICSSCDALNDDEKAQLLGVSLTIAARGGL